MKLMHQIYKYLATKNYKINLGKSRVLLSLIMFFFLLQLTNAKLLEVGTNGKNLKQLPDNMQFFSDNMQYQYEVNTQKSPNNDVGISHQHIWLG